MWLQEDKFLAMEIPLPSLAEQRSVLTRIVELSAKIQEARVFRQQVEDETHALIESAKRVSVGDPKVNPLGWPTLPLRDMAELRYGISAAISGARWDIGSERS